MVKGGGGRREVGFGSTELKVDVKEGLERYIELLLEKPLKVRAVVLLGSRARGDWKVHSDTDILVVAENLPENHKELLTTLNPRETWGLSLEPRAYTPEELLEAIWSLDLTALDAVGEGVVLYDDGFWKEAQRTFRAAKKEYGLRKIRGGWVALRPI